MKRIICIIMVFVMIIMLQGCGGGSSSSSKQPWKELGVSQREYEKVYNMIKYGS